MNEIRLLEKIVADQIAAGEVVERPSCIVKELIENSIDAQASNIQLEVDSGGLGRIRILDNGKGFPPGQVEKAFLRHATSKIHEIADLDEVKTFGFRGEALASISSVAKLCIKTRTEDELSGTELLMEAGEVLRKREIGIPVGVDFEVRDLFFNVPARLKFLKKESTELNHCFEAALRIALVKPEVSFKFFSNGRKIKEFLKVEDPFLRVKDLFSKESMAMARGGVSGAEAMAVLGPPHKAKAGTGSLYTYVNGRFVRDKTIFKAVQSGFAGLLESGRYPAGLISIILPPGSFDVNVHPQKIEVRFASPSLVFNAVCAVCQSLVSRSAWSGGESTFDNTSSDNCTTTSSQDNKTTHLKQQATQMQTAFKNTQGASVSETKKTYETRQSAFGASYDLQNRTQGTPLHNLKFQRENSITTEEIDYTNAPEKELYTNEQKNKEFEPVVLFSSLRYIGAGGGSFLLLDDGHDLVIIDQHAAHERVVFEKLLEQKQKGVVKSQRLLEPYVVESGPAQTEEILNLKEELSILGLEIERAGQDRISIYGVPADAASANLDSLLAELVIAISEGRKSTGGKTKNLELATIACHSSIRSGRKMDTQEVHALLSAMDKIDFAGHCPHGRPVLTRISWKEIRKKVKRE